MNVQGYVDEISHHWVRGWALDLNHHTDCVELVVMLDGLEHGRCIASRDRPGLAAALGKQVGDRHGFEYAFSPALSTSRDVTVSVLVASGLVMVNNGRRMLRGALRQRETLIPIMITSRGRAGSTLLMSDLGQHQDIIIGDTYPFEIKQAAYYASVRKVLTTIRYDKDVDFVEHAARLLRIGGNPWNRPDLLHAVGGKQLQRMFQDSVPARLNDLFRAIILDYYGIVATERSKVAARFFAEKTPIDEDIRLGIRDLFGEVREIVLVRDPRDYICSARSFWHMDTDKILQMLATVIPTIESMHQAKQADTRFIRYEDLVLEPLETRRSLYQFLGVAPPLGDVTQRTAKLFDGHATSASPADSIGRWKRDLSVAEVAACQKAFHSYFERFNYAI